MSRYSYGTRSRALVFLPFVVVGIGAIFLVVQTFTTTDSPGIPFMVLWIAALCWNGYWFLWRISYRVEVDGATLRWMTPLRRGEVPITSVVSVHPAWVGLFTDIEVGNSESVRLVTRTGVAGLAAALKQDRPEIEVTQSFGQRITSVKSIGGFKRED